MLQRILQQNALQYAPKRKAKCNETQGKILQNVAKTHQKHYFKRYFRHFDQLE